MSWDISSGLLDVIGKFPKISSISLKLLSRRNYFSTSYMQTAARVNASQFIFAAAAAPPVCSWG